MFPTAIIAFLCLTIVHIGSPNAAPCQLPFSTEQATKQLQSLEDRWLHAERDPSTLEEILGDDFIHVLPEGIITKKDQITFLRTHPSPSRSLNKHFEDVRIRVYGTTGVVNGTVVSLEAGTLRKTYFTDLFAWRSGRWQVVNAQENLASASR